MNCSATRIANSSKSSGNSPAETPSQRRERGDANRWQRQDTSSTGGLSSSPPLRSCSCWDSPDTARSASEPGGCSATFFILTSNCSVPAWMPFPTSRCCSTAGPSSPPGLNSCRETNRQLAVQAAASGELFRENTSLRRLLDLPIPAGWSYSAAEIILRDPLLWNERFSINRGSRDGHHGGSGGSHRHSGRASPSGRRRRPGRRTYRRRNHALQSESAFVGTVSGHRSNRHNQRRRAPSGAGPHSRRVSPRPVPLHPSRSRAYHRI